MQKEILTFDELTLLINSSAISNILVLAAPIVIALVLLELGISIWLKRNVYSLKDSFASILIGIGSILINLVAKIFIFASILLIYNALPWHIPFTWWSFVLCLIWMDFWRYVAHRISHESRFWWATHVVHHSSEYYNLTVAFRVSWIQHLKIVFFIPVALTGFHPVVFIICQQIEVLYQFWVHTELIKKLPAPIEYIFVTPSHHRVHHARNEKYLDKNYGSTLIIWDRMFGTFQQEEADIKLIFGITKPVKSHNFVHLVFHETIDILSDVYKSKSLSEAWQRTFVRPSQQAELEAKLKANEANK